MKKRKELDALLTMANGKKNGKSKRSKEGHELLRLDSDSNSSDNDELFLAPKKTVIRRPRQCQCCTMCIPLVMFILTMGCMVVTGGLIWMHFNLKQDLDDLRTKLEKVEMEADNAQAQQSTIMDLESRLQKISDVPEKVDMAAIRIRKLNETFHNLRGRQEELEKLKGRVETLEGKSSAASSNELQQIADMGSEIAALKVTSEENKDTVTSHGLQLAQVIDDVSTLKSQVAVLQQPPITQPRATIRPTTSVAATTSRKLSTDAMSAGTGDSAQFILLSEEIPKLWDAIHELNGSVGDLSSQHSQLAAAVAVLQSTNHSTVLPNPAPHPTNSSTVPAPHPTTSSTVPAPLPTNSSTVPAPHPTNSSVPQRIQTGQFDLAQMKADIENLKLECNRSIESSPMLEFLPESPEAINNTWVQLMTDRLGRLQDQVNELNPNDFNNNLLNLNTTRGIEQIMDKSLARFKAENLAEVTDITDIRSTMTNLQGDVDSMKSFQQEVGYRLTSITDQIRSLQQEGRQPQGEPPATPTSQPALTVAAPDQNPGNMTDPDPGPSP